MTCTTPVCLGGLWKAAPHRILSVGLKVSLTKLPAVVLKRFLKKLHTLISLPFESALKVLIGGCGCFRGSGEHSFSIRRSGKSAVCSWVPTLQHHCVVLAASHSCWCRSRPLCGYDLLACLLYQHYLQKPLVIIFRCHDTWFLRNTVLKIRMFYQFLVVKSEKMNSYLTAASSTVAWPALSPLCS